MKKYLDWKTMVEKLKAVDKHLLGDKIIVSDNQYKPPFKNFEEAMEWLDFENKQLESIDNQQTSKFEYFTTKMGLLQDEMEIMEKINSSENPESIFMTLKTDFFRDHGFIASVIEVCGKRYEKISKDWAKKLQKEFKKDKVKLEPNWLKETISSQMEAFSIRVQQKCEQEYKNLEELEHSEKEEQDKLVEEKFKALKKRVNDRTKK